MNVSLEKLNDTTAKLTVNVSESDYADKVKKDLKEIGKTHTIPGFRKGHISTDQLQRRFGKQVKSDVINREVYDAVIGYIRDNNLAILGEPMPVEVKEINLDDKDYTFEYEIGLTPEVKVELNKDVKLPFYTIEVSDDMVKQQDTQLRERFGAQVPGEEVDAKALVKGAIMELNPDGTVKESEDAIQVVDGIVAPMYFKSKEEADKFLGKKVGDKVVFNPWNTCEGNPAEMSSMLHIEDKEKAAQVKADFELAISEIIVLKLAEDGEEFYKNVFGADKVKTREEYDEALKSMIAQQLQPNSELMFNNDAQKYFVEKYGDMELPKEFLKKWLVKREQGDFKEETIDEQFEAMLPDLKWQLIKENIAKQLEVKIEEADLLNYAKSVAAHQFAQYGMTNMGDDVIADYAKRILADKNTRSRIVENVGNELLFRGIKNAITLENKTVTLDEFKELAAKQQ
ncbi:MAG: trigger factor [Muribaculaceae bacterium]|nr:trigger factor [Muribaculaceae bacterium]